MNMFFKILVSFYLLLFTTNNLLASSKEVHVVMRQIGHRLLQSCGDSTSRVLPVEHTIEGTYVLSFDKPIYVTSDSLYQITSLELEKIGIKDFVAELKACGNGEVFLSFLYSQSLDSITPCGGRNLPVGCYKLEITLLKDTPRYGLWILGFSSLVVGLFFYFKRSKKVEPIEISSRELLALGSYKFDILNRQLLHISHKESLTEKEAKLLTLLLNGINEVQNRDFLMHELWAESGIMVISKNLDVLVSKLRKKLSLDENIKITNVHGVGYKLEVIG
jgi:hypothetical protein